MGLLPSMNHSRQLALLGKRDKITAAPRAVARLISDPMVDIKFLPSVTLWLYLAALLYTFLIAGIENVREMNHKNFGLSPLAALLLLEVAEKKTLSFVLPKLS